MAKVEYRGLGAIKAMAAALNAAQAATNAHPGDDATPARSDRQVVRVARCRRKPISLAS